MEYFKNVEKIKYEGKKSRNPLAFKYYNPEELVLGKPMKDHLKFSVAYWHTFNAKGSDPFGVDTQVREWDNGKNDLEKALNKVDAAFEFMEKLGIEYFCFHDVDIVDEQDSLEETNRLLDLVVDKIELKMKETGIKLLWGTSNCFGHPRFMNGAATSPNADVFAYTAAKIKKALEITHRLNGSGYVFWGGREGYDSIHNTNMSLELDNYARMIKLAYDYANKIGFKGQFYVEPKPKEPTKHQYDYDVSTTMNFLRKYDLDDKVKFNIETNHATLAGHDVQHEVRYAAENGMLGTIDANQGDLQLGWDTDEFPTNIYDAVYVMYEIIKNGGLETGGLNFDSKVRRNSIDTDDLFYAHIVGMDTYAKALKIAARLYEDKVFETILDARYDSYTKGIGAKIISDQTDFEMLEEYASSLTTINNQSGRQEYILSIINSYIFETE